LHQICHIRFILNNEKLNSDGGIVPTGADSGVDQEESPAVSFRERKWQAGKAEPERDKSW
jgi:hypothetical protein